MHQLIFLGAPGCGKGTQAKILSSQKGYKHISTGDLLREEVAKGSELGQRISQIMSSGNLVDDETVLELLEANCDVDSGAYIFDGYPRNEQQALALGERVLKSALILPVYFKVDPAAVVERVVNRRTCAKCGAIYNLKTSPSKSEGVCDQCEGELKHRPDDTEEVVRNRILVYENAISAVLELYKKSNELVVLDASLEPSKVTEDLVRIIERAGK